MSVGPPPVATLPGRRAWLLSSLRSAAARPTSRDLLGIGVCTGYQVLVIVLAAALQVNLARAGAPTQAYLGSAVEPSLHNAGVYALWLVGALTLGLVPLAMATIASALSGVAIGSAVALHGVSALVFLGHALLESSGPRPSVARVGPCVPSADSPSEPPSPRHWPRCPRW